MATMIAAFSGKNHEFKTYLEEQRTAELFEAMQSVKQAIASLEVALPGYVTLSNTSTETQIYLRDSHALELIPGTASVTKLYDTTYFDYQLSKRWLGVEFIAWAKADEVKPVLSGEDIIRKMVEEVAGNEAD